MMMNPTTAAKFSSTFQTIKERIIYLNNFCAAVAVLSPQSSLRIKSTRVE
jgi:hypothetical protein